MRKDDGRQVIEIGERRNNLFFDFHLSIQVGLTILNHNASIDKPDLIVNWALPWGSQRNTATDNEYRRCSPCYSVHTRSSKTKS